MLRYVFYRILLMIPTLIAISVICFVVIQLPPGDIVSSTLDELQAQGQSVSQEQIAALRKTYNLDASMPVQYLRWIGGMLVGDLGYSMQHQQPVNELIGERLLLTVLVAFASLMLTWVLALPIGIVSAVKQYSLFDYAATVFAMLGMAVPGFMLALVVMWGAFELFGVSVGGLFSPHFINEPWSLARVVDLLKHLWIPMVVVGLAGTAGMVRRNHRHPRHDSGRNSAELPRHRPAPARGQLGGSHATVAEHHRHGADALVANPRTLRRHRRTRLQSAWRWLARCCRSLSHGLRLSSPLNAARRWGRTTDALAWTTIP